MDVVAHVLWAGAATVLVARRRPVTRRAVAATLVLAGLPDGLQFIPVLAWILSGDGAWTTLLALATSLPGREPPLPDVVWLASHHLHCTAHSAVAAGVATVVAWIALRSLWLPLLGWWSHILIDIFSHSADYYAVPVLYPFTQRGFDGIAWNTPWFLALNYMTLAGVGVWLLLHRRGAYDRTPPGDGEAHGRDGQAVNTGVQR